MKLLALDPPFGLNHLAPRHQLDFFAGKQAELGAELVGAQERRRTAGVFRPGEKGERLDGHDRFRTPRSKGDFNGVLGRNEAPVAMLLLKSPLSTGLRYVTSRGKQSGALWGEKAAMDVVRLPLAVRSPILSAVTRRPG